MIQREEGTEEFHPTCITASMIVESVPNTMNVNCQDEIKYEFDNQLHCGSVTWHAQSRNPPMLGIPSVFLAYTRISSIVVLISKISKD